MLFIALLVSSIYILPAISAEKPALQFASVAPNAEQQKSFRGTFEPFFRWIGKNLGRQIEVNYLNQVEEAVTRFKAGQLDYGSAGIVEFFQIQEQFPVQVILTMVKNKKTSYDACFVVNKKHAHCQLKDFKNKKIGYTSFHYAQGGLYPQILLLEHGFGNRLEHFFSAVTPYFKDITALYDLILGKLDVCVVSRATLDILAETAPGIIQKIHVLYHQDGLMFSPVFVRADMAEDLRAAIVQKSIEFTKTIEGKQLLMMFQIDSLAAVSDREYEKDKKRARRLGFIKQ
ncbi:phosphate/phosphite/phosphonate ABC transporter substrate-binding protein [candidate division CSSED10-310 bacterium]|uniref:Phosphate/phosphite/phosphonate ABC transporter substrate-binding protein n=1 Tax=candidate division CSSED10-310 bacterium TaxID=2855610 RepID=A0ABV6YX93_UNCC1